MAPNSSPVVARHNRGNSTRSMRRESGEVEPSEDRLRSISDPFMKLAFSIAVYLTNLRTGEENIRCRYCEKMDHLTKDMLVKHGMAFRGMMERLRLNEHNIIKSFEATVRETFSDGCNFGRIVAAYAFLITVIDYCLRHNMHDKITQIQMATAILITEQKEWINKNGGWVRTYFTSQRFKCQPLTQEEEVSHTGQQGISPKQYIYMCVSVCVCVRVSVCNKCK